MSSTAGRDVDEVLLAFTRALRSAGVGVTPDRATSFLSAAATVGSGDLARVHVAGRATLCSSPDDLDRYDQVFEAWFGDHHPLPRSVPRGSSRTLTSTLPLGDPGESGGEAQPDEVSAVASDVEVLRHRDVAALSADERALLDHLIRRIRPRPPMRRATRRTPHRRGDLDPRRTLRASMRALGEPTRPLHRRRGTQTRRVVLLVDVSASMKPYADTVLRLCHHLASTTPGTEVFTIGTRLTRVTEALATRDPDRALTRAGDTVPDWSGGTRLGETLRVFLDRWGARGLARGAVVVVFSDGWERGDAVDLGEQMARLSRLAHRVVWVNPHRGKTGYEPVQRGVVAVLPHCDHFVAGHSVRTFEEVVEVIADA